MPNYNKAAHLRESIESALGQSYGNIELIIVDDGSTDGSRAILEEYVAKYENVTVLYQPNQNASIARNKGIEIAKGEYFYFLDSDDMCYRDSLEHMVKYAVENNLDLVEGNINERYDGSDEVSPVTFFKEDGISSDISDFIDTWPAPPNKLYRADIIKNNGIVFGNVRIGQDLNFFLKYLPFASKIGYLKEPVYEFCIIDDSMSHHVSQKIFDIVTSVEDVEKFCALKGLKKYAADYLPTAKFHHYYRQMDKLRDLKSLREKKLFADYFSFHIDRITGMEQCVNFKAHEHDYRNYKLKSRFKWLYILLYR